MSTGPGLPGAGHGASARTAASHAAATARAPSRPGGASAKPSAGPNRSHAAEDQENVLEDHPECVFEPAPVEIDRPHPVDRLRPVRAAQELVEPDHHRRGDEHAPVPVERQERQRAEDVEMHLRPPAGQVDEQGGKQHLPDRDGVAGEVRTRVPEDKEDRHAREHPAEHGGGEDFDADEAQVRDGRVGAAPGGHGDAREPFESEQHGEHPVLAAREGGTLVPVELFAAILDVSGVCLHEPARGSERTVPRGFTEEEAGGIPERVKDTGRGRKTAPGLSAFCLLVFRLHPSSFPLACPFGLPKLCRWFLPLLLTLPPSRRRRP